MEGQGSSYAGDREEDIIRTKIDQLEFEANRIAEENNQINSHCNEDMFKLASIRRDERQVKQTAKTLDYQILANTKLRSKRDEAIRAYTHRIDRLEQKRRNVSMQLERRTFPKRDEESTMLAKSVSRALNYESNRKKQKIMQEAVMDDVKFAKRQLYLETKRMKADMAKRIFDRERQLIEENRKRHLEVLYQERMLQISKETIMNHRVKRTYKRIAQETEQKLKSMDFLSKKIETLEKVTEHQKSYLEDQRLKELEVVHRYKQLVCPPGAKFTDQRHSTSGFRAISQRARSRENSGLENSLADNSAATMSRQGKAHEHSGKTIKEKYDDKRPDLILMTTVDIDAVKPSKITVKDDFKSPSDSMGLPRVAEEGSRDDLRLASDDFLVSQSSNKDPDQPIIMTTSSGSRPFPKSSNKENSKELGSKPATSRDKIIDDFEENEENIRNLQNIGQKGSSFDFGIEESKSPADKLLNLKPENISLAQTQQKSMNNPETKLTSTGIPIKPNFKANTNTLPKS